MYLGIILYIFALLISFFTTVWLSYKGHFHIAFQNIFKKNFIHKKILWIYLLYMLVTLFNLIFFYYPAKLLDVNYPMVWTYFSIGVIMAIEFIHTLNSIIRKKNNIDVIDIERDFKFVSKLMIPAILLTVISVILIFIF